MFAEPDGSTNRSSPYDALQRKVSETSYGRTVGSQYDAAGNRTRLTYPDSNYIQYTYDILNRMQDVKQNGSTTLASYSYDDYSQVTGITRSNGVTTTATYSGTSQDWTLATSGSTGGNVTWSMAYTPAGQVYQRGVSNTAYAYSAPSASLSYSANNVNQYSSVGGTSYSYDGNGNLTSDGSRSFAYDDYNRLTGVSGSASLSIAYDPNGRLQQTTASSTTEQYLYDGDSLVVEYDGSGNILRRYVPGQATDETLVWYEGSGLSSPHWLHTDQQGTVVATTDGSGTATTYGYSPTGEPTSWGGATPTPIFRYTGQAALPAASIYFFKARMYDPRLGRFLQTDPIGYDGGMNLYAYAGNDPANNFDPRGLLSCGHENTISNGVETASDFAECGGCDTQECIQGVIDQVSQNGQAMVSQVEQALARIVKQAPVIIASARGGLCKVGNGLESLSALTGKLSLGTEVFGLVGAGVGGVFGVPEPGLALASAGGAVGVYGAAPLQVAGGIFQGLGGADYSNAYNGAITGGTGYALGRLYKTGRGIQSAFNRRTDRFINRANIVGGAVYDSLTNQFDQLAPHQESCPG